MNNLDSKRILESLPFHYYVIDCNTLEITDSNDPNLKKQSTKCYNHIFGFDKPCDQIDHQATCTCKMVKNTQEKIDLVQTILTLKGNIAHKVIASPIIDSNNEVTHVVSQYIDISKELKLESEFAKQNTELLAQNEEYEVINEELQEQKEEFESLYEEFKETNLSLEKAKDEVIGLKEFFENINESLQYGIWVTDKKDVIFYTNPAMEKIAGISRIDIINKNVLNDFPKETIQELTPYFEKAKSTLKPIWYEINVKTPGQRNTYQNGWLNPLLKRGEYNGMICTIRDVTENVSARNSIRVSEEKYRALYQNAPLSYQSLNIDGNVLDVNPQWLKTLGYQRNEVIGKWFGSFLNGDSVDHFRKNFSIFKRRGTVSNVQFQMKTKTGEIIYVSFEGCIGYTPEGEFEQTYCTFKNITDKRLAEQELKDSKEKLNQFVNESIDAQALIDSEGNILLWNKAHEVLTGYSFDEVKNKKLWDVQYELLTEEHREKYSKEGVKKLLKQLINSDIKNSENSKIELRIKRKDGTIRILEQNIFQLKTETETLLGSINRDITETKKAEQALIESEERYRRLTENSPEITYIYSLKNGALYWSSRIKDILGIDPSDLTQGSLTWTDSIHPDFKQEITDFFTKIKPGLTYILEYQIYDTKGDLHWFNDHIFNVYEKDDDIILEGIVTDVTEEKESELALKQSEERFRSVLENIQLIGVMLDTEGKITFVNDYLLKLTGREYKDIIGKDWFSTFLPESVRTDVNDFFIKAVDKQQMPVSHTNEIVTITGELKIIHWNNILHTNELGDVISVTSIGEDITTQALANEKIRKSENLLQRVFDTLPIGLWFADKNGKLIKGNPKGKEIWGAEPLVGIDEYGVFTARKMPSGEEIKPEDWALAQTIRDGVTIENEMLEIDAFDGVTRTILNYTSPVFDDKGNIENAIIVNLDITGLKKAEKDLLKNQQALQKIINITSERSKQDYFSSMVVALNEVFSANYIFIGKLIDGKKIETISLCHNGEIVENIIYDLKNAPCENVVKKETCIYANNVSQKFPKDLLLKELGVNGYVGIPLSNINGEAIGVLVALFHEKIRDEQFIKSICEVFAGNIGAELERTNAENALKESAQKFKVLSESSPMSVMMFQEDKWVYINPMAEKVTGYSIKELTNMNFWDFIHPDHVQIVKERGRARQSGDNAPYNYDFKIITKDGIEKWVSLYGASTMFSGKPAGILSVLDITELKTVELALIDSEQKLRNIAENSTNMFYQHTVDHKLTFLSPQVKDILGYTVDEAMDNWTSFLTDNPINLEAIKLTEKAIKTGETQLPYEIELQHKSGRNVWVEVREAPLIEKGKITGIVGALTDITKRKKANDALKESEKRYRKLFESANVGIGISTHQGDILDANQALTKIFNYSYKELLNINIKDLYKELDDRKTLLHAIEKDGEIRNLQIQMKPKGNTNLWVHISAQKFSDDTDDRILFVISDITKEKEAEIEIRKQESKFKKYIESSPMAIFIVNEKGKYTYANTAVTKLLGYSNQEILTMSIPDIKIVQSKNDMFNDFNELKEKGIFNGTEINYKAKDGRTINAIIDAVKLSENQYVAFCADVSQLKNIETKLKERNVEYLTLNEEMEEYIGKLQTLNKELQEAKLRAEESDRLKSAFLANMSHELRTPLNGILGFSTLMRKANLPKESMLRYSQIIETSGKRLLNVVNDLFDISLIHSDQLKVDKDLFKINEMLDEIDAFYHTIKKDKSESISLKLIKSSEKEINITNDKYRLHQIFKNLLDNAFKFTTEGEIEFGYAIKDKNKITFFVKDTGIGISKEYQKMIFTSFKQVDDSITRDYEGAGLGLAICAGLLERMGGRIWVESEKTKGSTFYFELPLNTNDEKSKEEKDFQDVKKTLLKDKMILIVEDDLVSYEFLKIYLENIGGSGIIQTANGEDAVKIVESTKVDLIFMDIRLPGIDGYETTRRIRKIDTKVKIIAQTAYALENDNKKSLAAGCNNHISKPIEEKVLIGIIQKYFA